MTQPRTTVLALVAAQCHLYLLHTKVSQAIAGDSLPLCQDQLRFPVTSKKPGFSFTETTEASTLHSLCLVNPLARTLPGQSAFPHYDGRAFCAPKADPTSRHEIGGPLFPPAASALFLLDHLLCLQAGCISCLRHTPDISCLCSTSLLPCSIQQK